MQNSLKLGFFIQPVHPPSRPYADVLREDREAVVLADRLGYREAFIGEHLVDAAETITSSLAFIASLADACPSITFGTSVLPLANYHPAMAAAQVAMVDHLVQGRLVLGVGPGVPGDAEAIGDLASDRNRKTHITWPLLTPTTLFLLVTLTIVSFQGFDIVKIMTQGGPVTATMIYVYYIYEQAFQYFKLGKASAAVVVFFVLIVALTFAQWLAFRRRVYYTT